MTSKDKQTIIVDILKTIEVPSDKIRTNIILNLSRLIDLLWSKSDKYEGPLYNGLQENEWSIIVVLIGNWVMESYGTIMKDKDVLKSDLELFTRKEYLTVFCISLLKGIIKEGLVPGTDEKEIEILDKIQQIPAIYNFIQDDLGKLKDQVKELFDQVFCCKCNYSKIKQTIMELSNSQGVLATTINKIKLYKNVAI